MSRRPANRNANRIELLRALEDQIRSCTRCPLHQTRTNAVPGSGSYTAALMIIGEAPGHNEDRQGLPFVGQAGKLLDKMLASIGLNRESVYITNVLKCRPPGNRDPRPAEIQACKPFLIKQISLIRPKAILLLGKYATAAVLGLSIKISKLRGRMFKCPVTGVYYFCTYHPAYVLRNPAVLQEYQGHFERLANALGGGFS